MKFRSAAFAMLFLFVTLFSPGASACKIDAMAPVQNSLPKSLRVIDEDAFDGTYFIELCLSSGVRSIGEGAFAHMSRLNYIYIPASVESIAETAFRSSGKIVIIGSVKSYAHEWAKKNGVSFITIDAWLAILSENQQMRRHRIERPDHRDGVSPLRIVVSKGVTTGDNISDPKDKPEMYPIDYDFP